MYFFGFGCILFGTIFYCLSEPKTRNTKPNRNSTEPEIEKEINQLNESDKPTANFELFEVK